MKIDKDHWNGLPLQLKNKIPNDIITTILAKNKQIIY